MPGLQAHSALHLLRVMVTGWNEQSRCLLPSKEEVCGNAHNVARAATSQAETCSAEMYGGQGNEKPLRSRRHLSSSERLRAPP